MLICSLENMKANNADVVEQIKVNTKSGTRLDGIEIGKTRGKL